MIADTFISWGNDNNNYWFGAPTTQFDGSPFINGWNLLKVDWNNSTQKSGSPTASAIDYLEVGVDITGVVGMTGIRFDQISVNMGIFLEYEYYSKFLFRDATTGAFQETVTDVSNLINLDTESYNLYVNLVASYAVQQQQGLEGLFYDSSFFANAYAEGVARYKALYKSQRQKPQTSYYRSTKPSYRRNLGGRYNY